MQYTVVIRTLGTAGEKYQTLLNSLAAQTIRPTAILVYIAEGYPIPKETIGVEQYIYVKKGMVAQRALPYDEVTTEYMLLLDDDLYLPEDTVEQMFRLLKDHNADVISPDIFPNAKRPLLGKVMMALSGRMLARYNDKEWGYKVMRNSGYSYNANPKKDVYWSQTNAGAACLCKKQDFLSIHFENELWLDEQPYALGEDQVMYYKMFLNGLKILTWYNHGMIHLDGGGNHSPEKMKRTIYSDFHFKTFFWHRFIFLLEKSFLLKIWDCICIGYTLIFALMISLLKGDFLILRSKWEGIQNAITMIQQLKK